MPSKDVHRKIRKFLEELGFGYPSKVDKIIDLPWQALGSKHRILFHTPEEAETIGMMFGGITGAFGGRMHVEVDKAASADKTLRTMLELWARTPAKKPGILVHWEPPKKVKVRIIRIPPRRSPLLMGEETERA